MPYLMQLFENQGGIIERKKVENLKDLLKEVHFIA